jgi:hypothetical protein
MICNEEHRYISDLENLPDSQAGEGRHKCAGCAYTLGYDDALGRRIPDLDADALNDSQAGTGRHKDVQAAYDLGYYHGLRRLHRD